MDSKGKSSATIETGKIESIPPFRTTHDNPKNKWTDIHYWTGNLVCLIIIVTFSLLLAFKRDVPNYLIALVGSILGYYVAKAPYDL